MANEKINFKDFIEWGDQLRIWKHMEEKGIVNPNTGKPYTALSVRLYLKGATKNTNTTIEQGITSYFKEKQRIREDLQKSLSDEKQKKP